MTATRITTTSEMRPAHWAFIFSPPNSTNSVMIGSAAKIDDRPSESPTGSVTCWYMWGLPSLGRPVKVVYPCLNRGQTELRFLGGFGGGERQCDAVKLEA